MEITTKFSLCIIFILSLAVHAAEPDIIVIGAGPAGLTAAITIKRQLPETQVTVIKSHERGQLESTDSIDNWPGHLPIPGEALLKKIEKEAISHGVTIEYDHIEEIRPYGDEKFIYGKNKTYQSNLVILATGARPHVPEILTPLLGKDVYTCTTCDGLRVKDKAAIVIGGGAHAIESALSLNKLNTDVTMIVRGRSLQSEQILIDELNKNHIRIMFNHEVHEVSFDDKNNLNGTVLRGNNGYSYIETQGIFSATGQKPQTEFVKNHLVLDSKSHIKCQDRSGIPCMTKGRDDATLLTLGNTAAPLLNTLTAAAKGASAALKLSKTLSNKHPDKKDLAIAVIGGGFGGGTASLYALRNKFNVILLEGENQRKTKKVQQFPQTRFRLAHFQLIKNDFIEDE